MSIAAWPGSSPFLRGSSQTHHTSDGLKQSLRSLQIGEQKLKQELKEGTQSSTSAGQVTKGSYFNAEAGDSQQDSCSCSCTRGRRWTSRLYTVKRKLAPCNRDYYHDHDEQSRKQSSSTTWTYSSTATTLVGSEPEPGKGDKDHHSKRDWKLPSLRRKLSPLTNTISLPLRLYKSIHHRHERLPETEEEQTARRKAKEERRRERWRRWGGMVDWEVDHEGESCGWACEVHRWIGRDGYVDWWVVAGMYV